MTVRGRQQPEDDLAGQKCAQMARPQLHQYGRSENLKMGMTAQIKLIRAEGTPDEG
ncbi:MAG: hypothetical protein ACLGG8_04455 [Gammaproteobacteria bacterium]